MFILSDNEYNITKINKENYQVFFVIDIRDNPEILILKDLFLDGELNTNDYTMKIKKEFKIKGSMK